jgi:hypothetical protein
MLRFTLLVGCVAAPFAGFIVSDWQMPHRVQRLSPSDPRNIEPIQWRGKISTEPSGG